jgi:hypothetical protein
MDAVMERTVKKQVRLTKEEARQLRELASVAKKTESDILRAGLALSKEEWDRRQRRARAIEGLKRLAVEVPGKKIPFRMK